MTFLITLLIAGFSGFIALSYEILWYRAFSFVSWGAPAAFGLLLGFYLLGVAGGSFFAKRFCKPRPDPNSRAELVPLAFFVAFANLTGYLVIPALARASTISWPGTTASAWQLVFLLVALSAGLFGAVLPLVAHFGIAPDERAGARLSYVYLANIIGSASGSCLTGFVLMDVLSSRGLSLLFLLLGFALAFGCAFVGTGSRRLLAIASTAVGALVLVAISGPLFSKLYERLLYKQAFGENTELKEVLENRHGVVAVNNNAQIYGGGAYDGAFSATLLDDKNMIERAFAVGAFHPHPKKVCVIGLSSGSWAQVLVHLPEVESMEVIEINPGYLELIAKYPAVASLLKNPKVHMNVDDGRRWLRRHPEAKFDVIVMNTSYHWRAHMTNLLSTEFAELARAHLLPGGIHYFNSTSSDDVQKTAATVFPYALRVVNFMAVSDSPIVFDLDRWKRTLRETRVDGGPPALLPEMNDTMWRKMMDLAASVREGQFFDGDQFYTLEDRDHLLKRTANAKIITDDNMASEWGRPFWEFHGTP